MIEINLVDGPIFEPKNGFEAKLHFFSGSFKIVQAVKMALFVNIQVRDINKKILEKNEIEVLSMTKMKPLKKHESLKIELNKYREIVQEAKAEFMFL